MSMQEIITETNRQNYPYIGVHKKGFRVMFTSQQTGFLLNDCTHLDDRACKYATFAEWYEWEFEVESRVKSIITEKK